MTNPTVCPQGGVPSPVMKSSIGNLSLGQRTTPGESQPIEVATTDTVTSGWMCTLQRKKGGDITPDRPGCVPGVYGHSLEPIGAARQSRRRYRLTALSRIGGVQGRQTATNVRSKMPIRALFGLCLEFCQSTLFKEPKFERVQWATVSIRHNNAGCYQVRWAFSNALRPSP